MSFTDNFGNPKGLLGRMMLVSMDKEHLPMAQWALERIKIPENGKVGELGAEMLPLLFENNPYMREIYPTEESRKALTVFQLYEGSGEWFDLSKKPIERDSFTFGGAESKAGGYFVTDDCIGCGSCLSDCPQSCLEIAVQNGIGSIAFCCISTGVFGTFTH